MDMNQLQLKEKKSAETTYLHCSPQTHALFTPSPTRTSLFYPLPSYTIARAPRRAPRPTNAPNASRRPTHGSDDKNSGREKTESKGGKSEAMTATWRTRRGRETTAHGARDALRKDIQIPKRRRRARCLLTTSSQLPLPASDDQARSGQERASNGGRRYVVGAWPERMPNRKRISDTTSAHPTTLPTLLSLRKATHPAELLLRLVLAKLHSRTYVCMRWKRGAHPHNKRLPHPNPVNVVWCAVRVSSLLPFSDGTLSSPDDDGAVAVHDFDFESRDAKSDVGRDRAHAPR
ncbi:hypothetical protein C8R45DRAFT_1221057 [Mycena sanguinolenta]|nr:hypothetical protein C8R45DRAFT_1221057 [Mycena sanguinolenta]